MSKKLGRHSRYRMFWKPLTFRGSLADAYRAMAADEEAEREAHEWIEGLIGDSLPVEGFRRPKRRKRL